MGRKNLYREMIFGSKLSDADIASYGLPAIPAALNNITVFNNHATGPICRTTLTLAEAPLLMVDNTGVTAYGGLKVLDFPVGAVVIHAALLNLTEVKKTAATTIIADAFDGDIAVGSVTATNTALASKDLAAAVNEQNIIAYTTMAQAAATTTPTSTTTGKAFSNIAATKLLDNTGGTAVDTVIDLTTTYAEAKAEAAVASLIDKANLLMDSVGGRKGVFLDGTTTAADIYINALIDDADHDITTETPYLYLTGTLSLFYSLLGDY
jgi:hypothetical protein